MLPILRAVVALYGLLFAILGLGFWIAPERLGQRFFVAAVNNPGLASLRADFGGLFLTLAALFLIAAWTRRRLPAIAAALMLATAIVGRLIGWGATGGLGGQAGALAVEVVGVALLALYARSLPRDPAALRPARGLLVLAAVVVVMAGLAAAAVLTPAVQQAMFARAADSNLSRSNAALLKDDALRVALCGTSAPLPSETRAKACVAVMAGGKFYIVDSGPESTERLMQWSLPLGEIGGVLITHFHSDHIGDLGELNLQTWVQGRPAPLAVFGGPGVERVVAGFNEAYALDQGYRTAHHTEQVMPAAPWPMVAHPVAMPPGAAPNTAVVLDDGKLKITAIQVSHEPVHPAYAYRFDYKGRSVVVTGDTADYAPLATAAKGADLLLSEALNREMIATMNRAATQAGRPKIAHIMADIQSYHISPTEAGRLADAADVKLLVLYHLLPAPDNFVLRKLFTRGLDKARHGQWDLADDGSLYTLPVGSKDVGIGRVP